jgi:hypothetical protein
MRKKSAVALVLALVLGTSGFSASAATVKNGVACPKVGATSLASVKGVKKIYVCTTNPAAAGNPNIAKSGLTWTLKTCVSYYAAYLGNQKSIDDQRSLVRVMNEPDKSTYTKELDASQANLIKVLAAIENGHCKTGL